MLAFELSTLSNIILLSIINIMYSILCETIKKMLP